MRYSAIVTIPGQYDFWALGSGVLVRVDEIKDMITGEYVTAGTMLGSVYDSDGDLVAAATITFAKATAGNGRFEGVIEVDPAVMRDGEMYTMKIEFTDTSPQWVTHHDADWKLTRLARYAAA